MSCDVTNLAVRECQEVFVVVHIHHDNRKNALVIDGLLIQLLCLNIDAVFTA